MRVKHLRASLKVQDLEGAEPGRVQAMFSVFNTIDQSNEVVLPSFFIDGQEVVMASWGHRWDRLPVGKGVIRVMPEGAVFDGQFFLNTQNGREHYETVKNLSDLQEWSFGFRVLEAEDGVFDGQAVTYLKRSEIFEVSPVLIGDNRSTATLAIKALSSSDADADTNPSDQSHDPNPEPVTGTTLDDDASAALAAVERFVTRTHSLAELRRKEGRAISTGRRTQLGTIRDQMREAAENIDAILAETAPPEKGQDPDLLKNFLSLERMRFQLLSA